MKVTVRNAAIATAAVTGVFATAAVAGRQYHKLTARRRESEARFARVLANGPDQIRTTTKAAVQRHF